MKKILCLLLAVACLFAIVSCNKGETEKSISDIIAESKPNTITTNVVYKLGDDVLSGEYITKKDGDNSLFEFNYKRYSTVAEMNPTRIKDVVGKVYYTDGKVTSTDGDEWVSAEVNQIVDYTIRLDETKFKTFSVSEDGKTLTAAFTADNSYNVLGIALETEGDISLSVRTNGTYLYYVDIEYKTASGAEVTVNTSYDYSPVTVVIPGTEA